MKKFSSLLVVLLLMLASFTAGVEYQRGDVDQDGQVNISDVTCLIDYLLSGTWSDESVTPPDGHEWVDLGLPSGTLWATCNVGASVPEDYGDYFAWGETEPKDYYDWSNYKWYEYGYADGYWHSGYTKYCTNSSDGLDGFVDNKTELDPSDDAACTYYPDGRMPSVEQIQELCNNCTWQWANRNGVNGQLVTGPNGNTMFLPAAGCCEYGLFEGAGSDVFFWSRTLNSGQPSNAYALYFDSEGWGDWHDSNDRHNGHSVRAVRVS